MNWRTIAIDQAGVIDRRQLYSTGLTPRQVRLMSDRTELCALGPGTYLPGGIPIAFAHRAWAATLWSGGALSHRSAAQLWQLPVPPSQAIHVTVADRRFRKSPAGVTTHRVPLGTEDTTRLAGLTLTNRSRTVLDLLRTERRGMARDLFDRAVQQQWITHDTVSRSLQREPGRTGNRQLRILLAEAEPGAQAESERILHQILKAAGLTGWVAQHQVDLTTGSAYLDVAFPEAMLAIEVDGRRYHDAAADRFESDRTRQNALMALGWRVLRFTWRRLTTDPYGVLAEILALLDTPFAIAQPG